MSLCIECGARATGVRPYEGPMCDRCALATAPPCKRCWNCEAGLLDDGACQNMCGPEENEPWGEGA